MSDNRVFVMETADMLATLADEQDVKKDAVNSAAKGPAEAEPFGLLGEQPARQSGGLTEMKPT
ncbi:MAG: hypothetical protein AB7I36_11650 [Rhodospirillaceae bacterium]